MKLGAISILAMLTAFDSGGKAGWKMDGDKIALNAEGNPIYLDQSGREMVVEQGTISRLNGEAREQREKKEAAETELAKFKGITDPAKALEALTIVGKLDQKKLIDAGEVDRVRKEIGDQFGAQITEKDAKITELSNTLNDMRIDSVFKDSKFLSENLAVPRDMVEATFRKNLKVVDGKIEVVDKDGNKLMSKTRAGEYATPEEGLQILIEQHPNKDQIIKANPGNGTGSSGNGGNSGTGRVVTRKEYDALDPKTQSDISAKALSGEIKLVD